MLRDFYDTHDLMQPIVYGIVPMSGGAPVYIGMTAHPSRRMDNYRNTRRCRNKRLAEWLCKNDAGFVVLYEGADYKAQEAKLIKARSSRLFNLVRGGDQSWRVHRRKPWMAKTGVRCPSDAAIRIIGLDSRTKDYKAWRSSLSDRDRCIHEMTVAYQLRWHAGFMQAFEKWVGFAADAVTSAIGADGFSRLTKSYG